MNKRTLTIIALSGALTLGACGLGGCGKKNSHSTHSKSADSVVVKVVVATVTESAFEEWGSYSADLRGIEDAVLTAPYQGGRVEWVAAVGTRVAKGSILCAIDSARYEAALGAANAQLALANGDLERTRANVEKGSLGRSALDGATLAFEGARMAQIGARRAYDDCRGLAPFGGILVSRTIEKFQSVAPGMPILRIARIDRLEATIAIPESEAFDYIKGMSAEFTLLQQPQQIYRGTISSIEQAIDSRSRTVSARLTIINSGDALKPGMVGRVRILKQKKSSAVVIPAGALLRLQDGLAVMLVKDGVARQQKVKGGFQNGDMIEITEGLTPGDLLITTGAFQVSTGTRVAY